MMSLPFFGIALGLAAGLLGRRGVAVALWVASIVVLMVLFRVHATDPLAIVL